MNELIIDILFPPSGFKYSCKNDMSYKQADFLFVCLARLSLRSERFYTNGHATQGEFDKPVYIVKESVGLGIFNISLQDINQVPGLRKVNQ